MAEQDRNPQTFPKAPLRSAEQYPPRPSHSGPGWPHNGKPPAHCAGVARGIAAARRWNHQTGASNLASSVYFYQYFRKTTTFGHAVHLVVQKSQFGGSTV